MSPDKDKQASCIADEVQVNILKNQNGERNLLLHDEYGRRTSFYSHRNIRRELDLFSENLCIPENRIIVLLGLGLGYHLREILKKPGSL